MTSASMALRAIAIAALIACTAGCDSESGSLSPNEEPNTRISAGPPELRDTSFRVNLFWFGWDDDGEISHYEIAWETPEQWIGPIFSTDSLFVVEASDTCCVEPLPDYGTVLPDSVYSQFHTFYVRSVDNEGVPDPTPAVRSFNAKTIAPYTQVNSGPQNNGFWSSNVAFTWTGFDDDGIVVSYETALVGSHEFEYEFDRPPTGPELVAWIDTLTFRPLPSGEYSTERVWVPTVLDSVLYPNLLPREGVYAFAVRSIDNAGAKERVLTVGDNVRTFGVQPDQDGPRITLVSNVAGVWRSGELSTVRDVFAGQGIRFRWSAVPGPSSIPVAGFSHSIEDTSGWTPFTLNDVEWPDQIEGQPPNLWFPPPGTHKFFVRAQDAAGFIRVLVATISAFGGPRTVSSGDLYVLVVLDTDPDILQDSGIWPEAYDEIELSMIDYFFDGGYNFQVRPTRAGTIRPTVFELNTASSVFWFHGGDVFNFDSTVLLSYHESNRNPNILPSYISSGGNLFLCGIEPVNAMKYFEDIEAPAPVQQLQFPVDFSRTITDPTLVPHWAYVQLGISQIDDSITNLESLPVLPGAKSTITTGPNPYPDLPFDPLSIPNGPVLGGFRYYDIGVHPSPDAEIIYEHPVTGEPLGVRKLTQPGVNGNTVYLGFHPYFIRKNSFRTLLRAVLTDFGEFPTVTE